MNKTYKIQLPRNKEAQNIKTSIKTSIKDGTIEVSVELKDNWKPKDGDIVISNNLGRHRNVCVFFESPEENRYVMYDIWIHKLSYMPSRYWSWVLPACPATASEKQLLFDALAKDVGCSEESGGGLAEVEGGERLSLLLYQELRCNNSSR